MFLGGLAAHLSAPPAMLTADNFKEDLRLQQGKNNSKENVYTSLTTF